MILVCAANVSEGRDHGRIARLAAAGADALLDAHSDPHHHRTVLTLAGERVAVEAAMRSVAEAAVTLLDLTEHRGVHPRLGVLDVVPFVAYRPAPSPAHGAQGDVVLDEAPVEEAIPSRDRFARWFAEEWAVPCFLYGPLPGGAERTLPDIRRRAFTSLAPDTGPPRPHPTAGATAVGARTCLVAYNLFVTGGDLALARSVAAALRRPGLRTLGLDVGGVPQVSCNLTEPSRIGPAAVYDEVAAALAVHGAAIARAELVGLLPARVLGAVPEGRRAELGLAGTPTIEARLARRRGTAADPVREPGHTVSR